MKKTEKQQAVQIATARYIENHLTKAASSKGLGRHAIKKISQVLLDMLASRFEDGYFNLSGIEFSVEDGYGITITTQVAGSQLILSASFDMMVVANYIGPRMRASLTKHGQKKRIAETAGSSETQELGHMLLRMGDLVEGYKEAELERKNQKGREQLSKRVKETTSFVKKEVSNG